MGPENTDGTRAMAMDDEARDSGGDGGRRLHERPGDRGGAGRSPDERGALADAAGVPGAGGGARGGGAGSGESSGGDGDRAASRGPVPGAGKGEAVSSRIAN